MSAMTGKHLGYLYAVLHTDVCHIMTSKSRCTLHTLVSS